MEIERDPDMDTWSRWDLIDYIVRRLTTKDLKGLAIKIADKYEY